MAESFFPKRGNLSPAERSGIKFLLTQQPHRMVKTSNNNINGNNNSNIRIRVIVTVIIIIMVTFIHINPTSEYHFSHALIGQEK